MERACAVRKQERSEPSPQPPQSQWQRVWEAHERTVQLVERSRVSRERTMVLIERRRQLLTR